MARSFDPSVVSNLIADAIKSDLLGLPFDNSPGVAALRQFSSSMNESLLKKFDSSASDDLERLEGEAFNRFLKRCESYPSLDLLSGVHLPCGRIVPLIRVLSLMRSIVFNIVGKCLTEEVLFNSKHGPGVTRGVKFSDTSSNQKWSAPVSSTDLCGQLIQHLVPKYDPVLWDAIAIKWIASESLPLLDVVSGSRATTVPKDKNRRRMIAVEPTGNMYFQQGLMVTLYSRLKVFGYDVAVLPDLHKQMAMESSVGGHLATIDFSDASDSVGWELVQLLFPADWVSWFRMTRSPSMEIRGVSIDLPVYATMGNATTFPVETIVFLSLMLALEQLNNAPVGTYYPWVIGSQDTSRFSVFGDDCILPTGLADCFCQVSYLLGFSVNSEKSYLSGGFRESCGGDYYHGCNVRGLYIKRPMVTKLWCLEPWLYTLLNQLVQKYILCFGARDYVYGRQAFSTIVQLFRDYGLRFKVVPPSLPEDSGFNHPDWKRFTLSYRVPLSPVYLDGSRGVRFRRLVWKYPTKSEQPDNLVYAEWLRRSTRFGSGGRLDYLSEPILPFMPPRKVKGHYVVVWEQTNFWTL